MAKIFLMRIVFCLFALLCVLSAHALAGTLGISGEWHFYGNQGALVRIDETSGILEDGTTNTSYILLLEKQGVNWLRATQKRASHPGEARKILRMHENVLLFSGLKTPILVRKGARFTPPREKIRGRWHYAAQMNEAFYYDAEFDLDAKKMIEISRSENGNSIRSESRPLETLLDAQAELALRADGAVYHFTRLGADFLVLEPSYAASTRNGYKILLARTQADTKNEAATAPPAKTPRANRKNTQGKKAAQKKL